MERGVAVEDPVLQGVGAGAGQILRINGGVIPDLVAGSFAGSGNKLKNRAGSDVGLLCGDGDAPVVLSLTPFGAVGNRIGGSESSGLGGGVQIKIRPGGAFRRGVRQENGRCYCER